MSPIPSHPKLRWPLDIRRDTYDGQDILILSCPLGVSPEPLVLVAQVSPLVGALDGTQTIEEICAQFSEYGVKQTLVEELVALLDRGLFLATPQYFAAEAQMKETFRASTTRAPALAGRAYAASHSLLETEIDEYLSHGSVPTDSNSTKLTCLVSPHIDYRRGGVCYGRTYQYLREAPHDLYILIGTSHQYSRHMFHLSNKDFTNPLGTLPCDRGFITALGNRYGEKRSFDDEYLHKKEHSLELQIPFMSKLLNSPTIAPVLVGGFHHMLQGDKLPQSFEDYESFAAALTETYQEYVKLGKKICFIAGVDMAHVGKNFGDAEALTPETMEKVRARDEIYLHALKTQNKDLLWSHVAEDSDARRICGFPTMYLLLDVFARLGVKYSAEQFDYQQAVDYPTDCAVTFAGMGMYQA